MAGYRRRGRRSKRRTWEGSKKRHKQAVARGWRLHAPKSWHPKKPKWKGATTSTAKVKPRKKKRGGVSHAELAHAHAQRGRIAAQMARERAESHRGRKKKSRDMRDMRDMRNMEERSWSGEGKRHGQAAARGWQGTSKSGWIPKYRGKKHPTYSGSLSSTAGHAAHARGEKISRKAARKLARGMGGSAPPVHHLTASATYKKKGAKKLKSGRNYEMSDGSRDMRDMRDTRDMDGRNYENGRNYESRDMRGGSRHGGRRHRRRSFRRHSHHARGRSW